MPIKHVDNNVSVANVSYGLADAIYGVVSQYTDKFSHESGSNVLTFDGDCQVNFNNNVIGIKQGEDIFYNLTSAWDTGLGPANIISYYTDNICLLELQWSRWGDPRRLFLLFISKDGRKLLGFNQDARYYDAVSNGLFIDMKSKYDNTYRLRPIMTITQPLSSPNILFADCAVITNMIGDCVCIEDIKTCSSVSLFSEPTINDKHYFALGYSALIEVET